MSTLYQKRTDRSFYLATYHDGSEESLRRIKDVIQGTDWRLEIDYVRRIDTWDWSKGRPPSQRNSLFGGKVGTPYLVNKKKKIRKRQRIKSGKWVVSKKRGNSVSIISDGAFQKIYGKHPLEIRNYPVNQNPKRNYFT